MELTEGDGWGVGLGGGEETKGSGGILLKLRVEKERRRGKKGECGGKEEGKGRADEGKVIRERIRM